MRAVPEAPVGAGTLAVIDIGSNSGRLVVFRRGSMHHLEVLDDARASLRLAREHPDGVLSQRAIDRTMRVLHDFVDIANAAGASPVLAVATSAVRESRNAAVFVDRVRGELGLDLSVIDGETEARYAFLGAVHSLPAMHGMLLDVGGGSVELTRFRDRRLVDCWSFPLGALRVSDRFLLDDPPTSKNIRTLEAHVSELLGEIGITPLAPDEVMIGTGGTIRNLAKVDRRRQAYPIYRLHGYELSTASLSEIVDVLTERPAGRRARVPGLNADRADSIIGGALVVQQIASTLEADPIVVSGQGIREGLVIEWAHGEQPPAPAAVRRESVFALASRFSYWNAGGARRRARIALDLLKVLRPEISEDLLEVVEHAAVALDLGRSVDYYNLHDATAWIISSADLSGFSHRQLALISALVRMVGSENMRLKPYRPLVDEADRPDLARASVVIALADEIERRLGPDPAPELVWTLHPGRVELSTSISGAWRPRALAARFKRAFGLRLAISGETEPE
ncbi:MAG: Ppx/GppA family phosphatase [Actinomycetota bacterium]|nr:Ppx/GppA family phosphatase [Actinomycetota bacterium]